MVTIEKIELFTQLTGNEYKLYSFLLYIRNKENNIVKRSQEELRRELEIAPATFYKSIETLTKLGLIEYQGMKKRITILQVIE